MVALTPGILFTRQNGRWIIFSFLHLPGGNTCKHGGNYIFSCISVKIPFFVVSTVMHLLRMRIRNTRLASCRHGNGKYDVVPRLFYSKLRKPAALNGSYFIHVKSAALKKHWKNFASNTLPFYGHRTLKTELLPFMIMLSEAWLKDWILPRFQNSKL